MTTKIAINGFGRIGRLFMRALMEQKPKDIELVLLNDPGTLEANLHLLKYDSVHGRVDFDAKIDGDTFDVGLGPIHKFATRNPAEVPLKDFDIDILVDCSGKFNDKESAQVHFDQGAKKVFLSAPGKGADVTVVYGVNHTDIKPEHKLISNASCTTNCIAPVSKVLHETVGIERGFMTTVHAFTGDQRMLDNSHKDLRRARAAGESLVPTSTGAAKAVGLVLPELAGKLDGTAIRVPIPNVSLVDLTFDAGKATSVEDINNAMIAASKGALKGVLATTDEPLVSIDFNHHPASAIFDLSQTQVIDGTFVRILAWYDNEWGFSCRMVDTLKTIANL